jgi:hypothetical protein
MFEGKMFFGVTGTPIRYTAFVNKAFADAEPVPFTFAKRTTKSFTAILIEPASYRGINSLRIPNLRLLSSESSTMLSVLAAHLRFRD